MGMENPSVIYIYSYVLYIYYTLFVHKISIYRKYSQHFSATVTGGEVRNILGLGFAHRQSAELLIIHNYPNESN